MGRRLQRWRALDARERWRLIGCVIGLWCVHASLAVFGYGRTRRMIERGSLRTPTRAASAAEIADAQVLARLAASAGRNAMGEATCLRRALLLEFAALGFIAGLLASVFAQFVLLALQYWVFDLPLQLSPQLWWPAPILGALFIGGAGAVGAGNSLRGSPLQVLRLGS